MTVSHLSQLRHLDVAHPSEQDRVHETTVHTMLKDSQSPRYSVPRTRRTYTPQFKTELIAACQQPGASIAALALQHGMNANVLHRWLKDQRQEALLLIDGVPAPAFLPIDLAASRPISGSDSEPSAPPPNIAYSGERDR